MARQAPERLRRDTSVTMRIPQQTKDLIENAAAKVSKSFSAFVIDSARQNAVDVILDQTVFNLSAEQASAFANLLDHPPGPTDELKQLMRARAPWEV